MGGEEFQNKFGYGWGGVTGAESALGESVESFPYIRQADAAWVCSGALVLGCWGGTGLGHVWRGNFPTGG